MHHCPAIFHQHLLCYARTPNATCLLDCISRYLCLSLSFMFLRTYPRQVCMCVIKRTFQLEAALGQLTEFIQLLLKSVNFALNTRGLGAGKERRDRCWAVPVTKVGQCADYTQVTCSLRGKPKARSFFSLLCVYILFITLSILDSLCTKYDTPQYWHAVSASPIAAISFGNGLLGDETFRPGGVGILPNGNGSLQALRHLPFPPNHFRRSQSPPK